MDAVLDDIEGLKCAPSHASVLEEGSVMDRVLSAWSSCSFGDNAADTCNKICCHALGLGGLGFFNFGDDAVDARNEIVTGSSFANKALLVREGGKQFVASVPAIGGYLADLINAGSKKVFDYDLYAGGYKEHGGSAGKAFQSWIKNKLDYVDPVDMIIGKPKVETEGDQLVVDGTEAVLDVASIFVGGAGLSKLPGTGTKLISAGSKLKKAFDAEKAAGALYLARKTLAKGFKVAGKGEVLAKKAVNLATTPLKIIPGGQAAGKVAIYGAAANAVDNATGKHGKNVAHDLVDGAITDGTKMQEAFNTIVSDPREGGIFDQDGGNRTAEQKAADPRDEDRFTVSDFLPESMQGSWEDLPKWVRGSAGAAIGFIASSPFRMICSGGSLMSKIIRTISTVASVAIGCGFLMNNEATKGDKLKSFFSERSKGDDDPKGPEDKGGPSSGVALMRPQVPLPDAP